MLKELIIRSHSDNFRQLVNDRLREIPDVEIEETATHAPHLVNLIRFLDRIKELYSLPNQWCGKDTYAPVDSLINTMNVLCILPPEVVLRLKPEDMMPTPTGTVVLDWENHKNESFSLEVGRMKANYFVERQNEILKAKDGLELEQIHQWINEISVIINGLYE